jgi:hypothetical protein
MSWQENIEEEDAHLMVIRNKEKGEWAQIFPSRTQFQ